MTPDFNGRWRFNRARSRLEIPAPDETTRSVKHREPQFELTRSHVFDGKADTVTIALSTDGSDTTLQSLQVGADRSLLFVSAIWWTLF